jgi:hypothetical protein
MRETTVSCHNCPNLHCSQETAKIAETKTKTPHLADGSAESEYLEKRKLQERPSDEQSN